MIQIHILGFFQPICVHYGLNTVPGVFLDHIGGVYTGLCDYFIILSGFMVQIVRKYDKVDHHVKPKYYDYDQSVTPVCPLRVQYLIRGVSRPYWRCLYMFV